MSLQEAKQLLLNKEQNKGKKDKEFRRRYNNIIRSGKRQSDIDGFIHELKGGADPTFTEEDYNANDGFQTYTWGPLAWTFLHMVSMNYRPEKKVHYESYLNALQQVLPCLHCRDNFTKNLQDAKKEMIKQKIIENEDDVYRDRKNFSHFIWYLHHMVNKMLGKYPDTGTDKEPTFEQTRDMFETFRSRCLTEEEIKQLEENKEGGCTAAIYGADAKAKCTIKFEPRHSSYVKSTRIGKGIQISSRCQVKKRKDE
jgi:hypothetical protein